MNEVLHGERYRVLRRITTGLLGVGLAVLLLDVALAAYLRYGYRTLDLNRHPELAVAGMVLALTVCCGGPVIVLWLLTRRGWLSWKHLGGLAILQGAVFTYLLIDDAEVRHPQSIEAFSPALATDRASFQLTLRWSKGTPEAQTLRIPPFAVGPGTAKIVSDPAAWTTFLRQNRPKIEAGWAELQPVRAWWDEMAAQPTLGDLTTSVVSAPLLPFQPIRSYAQYACAIASLQALDGRGDEAIATLSHVYSVARKLEPNSRTLVRAMIARVVEGLVVDTAGFVLATTPVSLAGRRAFTRELNATIGGAAGVRRIAWIEYHFAQPGYLAAVIATGKHTVTSGAGLILAPLSRLLVNPHRTLNLLADRCEAIATLAAAQRLDELKALEQQSTASQSGWLPVKNCGGYFLTDLYQPAYAKLVENYWKTEARRTALLDRLNAGTTP